MTAARLLPRRDAAEPADPLVRQLLPRRDDRLLAKAGVIAVALHVPLLFLSVPERPHEPPHIVTDPGITLHRLPLKPPERVPFERPPVQQPGPRRPFLESAPPDEPGPVEEETPVEITSFAPVVVSDLIADPEEPPAPPGPLELFAPGVEAPVLIPACKVDPEYPELARQARLEGSVVLRAVIRADGSVGEAAVLSARPAGLGFEDAAIEAVLQWCYEPATQRGLPVDVYFTIYVSFRLH